MTKMLSTNYANITARSLELYKSYCTECQRKKKRPTVTGVVVRPLLTSDFNSRGQVDLIDMQSKPHPGNKWIMAYQDHLTTFCVIRAIVCKRAAEVALHLVDIFLLLGAPVVLRSDNGSEFKMQMRLRKYKGCGQASSWCVIKPAIHRANVQLKEPMGI